ncbi:Z1 domain-containing protein [Pararhodospirillum oryzae]|uniref:Endonuclease n=1 Tax=Pararhodospirillum oryzae TaxID=478448 RepID=A0A512HAZ2_9PROT|nr:endonuclease [Pararhodospirillum oryzae]
MSASPEDIRNKVIKFVQELLVDEGDRTAITVDLIGEMIDKVLGMQPRWGIGLDRDAVTTEVIRRFSLWIGRDGTLSSEEGHIRWLTSARKRDWRYWQRYRQWMEGRLAPAAVERLDESTDTVLGLLEDPLREGRWDRRGLVVGHVQSGKTGHYTGLICKAADAGYKIIIVLAGLHNNLRSQTQMRLDEGFLGYETKPGDEDLRIIGVGHIDSDPSIRPNFATNRSNNGDFNLKTAQNMGISPEQRPWLFVVKKNKTVLERLLRWIRSHVANTHDAETGRKIVTNLPLLLIDDEADHASVDTGEQVFGDDGQPDPDYQPTAINRLIRRILVAFTRSAYVGYTATPFANIFIHERKATKEEGPDLFPSAFILNLAVPSNYVGAGRVFGLAGENGRNGGLPLVRDVTDASSPDGTTAWMPAGHRNHHQPLHMGEAVIPPSLAQAVDAFLLACAVRTVRGQDGEHSSMLIHVTRFTSVQKEVHRQVEDYVRQRRQRLRRGIGRKEVLAALRGLWESDFLPVTAAVRASGLDGLKTDPFGWQEIVDVLPDVVSDIQVRMINGTAKDALDYADQDGAGLKVIAVGGDKLARGLTLEGLSVSYFLRASRMYDTLMQMGRWFGYRPGYLDLCRLYTTADLTEWFGHVADASEELREEFDLMEVAGATPREYGLKVQSHPVLMVTSPLKMRSAKTLMLSFSGQLVETVALFRDSTELLENLIATRRLLDGLPAPEVNPERRRGDGKQAWQGYLWDNIPAADIIDFLTDFQTHPDAHKVDSLLLARFIQQMVAEGELTHWTIALIGGGQGGRLTLSDGLSVDMIRRTPKATDGNRLSIGRLMSPRDEAIDLDNAAWQAALDLTREAWHADPGRKEGSSEPDSPNGPAVRRIRGMGAPGVPAHPERGVLYLYAIEPPEEDLPEIIAFAASFPASSSGTKVEYKVNNVMWEQESSASE